MMKKKIGMVGLLCCISSLALANTITVVNDSEKHNPVSIKYKIAHKNKNGATVFSPTTTLNVADNASINVDLDGYDIVGIVPIAIDGHAYPTNVTQFDAPMSCAVVTDATHSIQYLHLGANMRPDGHGSISCSFEHNH